MLKNNMSLLMRIRDDKRGKHRPRWGIVFLCNQLGNTLSLRPSEKGSEGHLQRGWGGVFAVFRVKPVTWGMLD